MNSTRARYGMAVCVVTYTNGPKKKDYDTIFLKHVLVSTISSQLTISNQHLLSLQKGSYKLTCSLITLFTFVKMFFYPKLGINFAN